MESSSDSWRVERAGLKLSVDNRIPIKAYYDLATDLLRKANVHRENKMVIELYVTLLRFSSLVLETIPHHRDYTTKHLKQIHVLTKKACSAKDELECLKLDIDGHIDKLNADIKDITSPTATDNCPLFKQAEIIIGESEEDREDEPNGMEDQQKYCTKLQYLTDYVTILTKETFVLTRNSLQCDKAAREALREAKKSESLYKKEARRRRERDEILMDLLPKLENARIQQDALHIELQKVDEDKLKLETVISNLEDKLRTSQCQVELLLKERFDAKHDVKSLCLRMEPTCSEMTPTMLNFTSSELKQATSNFDDASKIGEGRYTTVFRGFIRHTSVAIKRINGPCFDGQPNFYREVIPVFEMRHI